MRAPALQETILAHLRGAKQPVSSRDLASRFLRIGNADEATCHRLLAPVLAPVDGVEHRPGRGWLYAPPRPSREPERSQGPTDRPPTAGAAPGAWLDFVALASEGSGPGGSGAVRAVSLLPVVAGQECQEEHLPAWVSGNEELVAEAETPGGGRGVASRGPWCAPGLGESDLDALIEAIGDLPVVCHRVGRDLEPLRRACAVAGRAFHPRVASLSRLAHHLLGLKANHALVELGAVLGVESRGPDDCRGRVRLVARCFLEIVPRLDAAGVESWEGLAEYLSLPAAPLDLSRYAFTADDLKALPAAAGVYRFRDRAGDVIYIGKARNLRARVGAYFVPSARGTAKGRAILEQVHSIEIEPCASELEAILTEAALLAEHRPRLNRQFDVHERPAPYGPRLNLVVVLPEPATAGQRPRTCTLHLLRRGRYVQRVRGLASRRTGADAGGPDAPWGSIARTIGAVYFAPPAPDTAPRPEGQGGDVDWQLVGSFLRKHRDEVSVLDVDESPSVQAACERLGVLVDAALAGDRRIVAR